jgi:hypothetical protein
MKVYLASFLEPENFGPGRVVGVVDGNKPATIDIDSRFPPFIPPKELINKYNFMAIDDQKAASEMFVLKFEKQLDEFVDKVFKKAEESGTDPTDILPFKEGDTLASWERADRRNYRGMIAVTLMKLGYEVVKN